VRQAAAGWLGRRGLAVPGPGYRRAPHRRPFSELDPASLAEQLHYVGPCEKPGVYRRLGDLALFPLGVFPDQPPSFRGPSGDRLLRLCGLGAVGRSDRDGQALLEFGA